MLPKTINEQIQKDRSDAFWMHLNLRWRTLLFVAGCLLIALCLGMEINFVYSFFEFVTPEAESQNHIAISNGIKAMIAVIAVIALHLALPKEAQSNATIGKIIIYMAIALFIAIGCAFTYSISSTGLLDAGDTESRLPVGTVISATPPWLLDFYKETVLPNYPAILSITLPVVTLLTAFVSHKLIGALYSLAKDIMELRGVGGPLKDQSEATINHAVDRAQVQNKISSHTQQLQNENLPDLIYVAASDALGLLNSALEERIKNPNDIEILESSKRYQEVPSFYFRADIQRVEQRLDDIRKQINLEFIKKALKGDIQ